MYVLREDTIKFLHSTTDTTLKHDRRRELLSKFSIPACDSAHTLKVHATLFGIISKPAKKQQFVMDALGPLTWLYEQFRNAKMVDHSKVKLAVHSTMSLLGNASAHMSLEWHKAVMKYFNEETVCRHMKKA